jgi:hypothetical protein
MSSSNRTYNDLCLMLRRTIVNRQASPRPSERSMTPYRSLQLSCPSKLFLVQESVDRPSKRTIGSLLVPQRTTATRQAVRHPTQHSQTISSPSKPIGSFLSLNIQLPSTRQAVPLPTQRRHSKPALSCPSPSLRPDGFFPVPQHTIANHQASPRPLASERWQ